MERLIGVLTTLVLLLQICSAQVRQLGSYGGNSSAISVSGIDSGASFSIQFHVCYSADVMGVGIIAGAPYYCANATTAGATTCTLNGYAIDANFLVAVTNEVAATGAIDPVSNMENDKVFIFDGTLDTVVTPESGQKCLEYYSSFGADIETEFSIVAEHCMPTENYGNPCPILGSPFISQCGYSAPFEILDHVYGNLQRPSGHVPLNGDFYQFDQTEFVSPSPSAISMDNIGYVYVPSNCVSNTDCKVHFAFHGCEQGISVIGDVFVRNAGYNEIGELNDIIIVYPQVVESLLLDNVQDCWDWWGYTNVDYATNVGPQMVAIRAMLDRVLN